MKLDLDADKIQDLLYAIDTATAVKLRYPNQIDPEEDNQQISRWRAIRQEIMENVSGS